MESALFRVSRFGDGGVVEVAREKRPKEWKDVGAEKPRDARGESPEEGARSRARVSLNLNLRFAGPPLVSLVFILSRGPCVRVVSQNPWIARATDFHDIPRELDSPETRVIDARTEMSRNSTCIEKLMSQS